MGTLKTFKLKAYRVNILELDEPIYGGLYAVELLKNNTVIKYLDGFTLDGAFDIFRETVNAIKKYE